MAWEFDFDVEPNESLESAMARAGIPEYMWNVFICYWVFAATLEEMGRPLTAEERQALMGKALVLSGIVSYSDNNSRTRSIYSSVFSAQEEPHLQAENDD